MRRRQQRPAREPAAYQPDSDGYERTQRTVEKGGASLAWPAAKSSAEPFPCDRQLPSALPGTFGERPADSSQGFAEMTRNSIELADDRVGVAGTVPRGAYPPSLPMSHREVRLLSVARRTVAVLVLALTVAVVLSAVGAVEGCRKAAPGPSDAGVPAAGNEAPVSSGSDAGATPSGNEAPITLYARMKVALYQANVPEELVDVGEVDDRALLHVLEGPSRSVSHPRGHG